MNVRQTIKYRTRRYRMWALISAAAAVTALSGLAATGSAQAAVSSPAHAVSVGAARTAAPDVEYSCSGTPSTTSRSCYFQTQNGDAPLFYPSGSLHLQLPPNDKVHVTCYYYGNPPSGWLNDGVQDHVNWTEVTGNTTGHIPDPYIDEGGENPWNAPYYITEC